MNYKDVSVVMISRNEEKAVAKVINDIKRHVPGSESLLVDSSTDNTPKIAAKLGAKIIRQFPPKGYGPAMEKALLTPKTEIVVTLDCDNTYPTNVIPLLVNKIKEGYDIVGTSRISKGKPKNMPYLNYFVNLFVNLSASLLFLRAIRDIHSGMRAYRGSLLQSIKWKSKGAALPVELLLKPINLGFKVTEIPIFYKQRVGETKLDRVNSLLWTFRRIFSSRFSQKINFVYLSIVLLLLFFTINNFLNYSPLWGYDAKTHIKYFVELYSYGHIPMDLNYSSNPPFYYLIAGLIYFLFHSLKLVQLFSLFLYLAFILFLCQSLKLINKGNKNLNFFIVVFFSVLPLSLSYGYMILNYTLGHFFSLAFLFVMIFLVQKKRELNFKWVGLIGVLSSLSVLTSFTNLYIYLLSFLFVLFFPELNIITKIKMVFLLGLITLVMITPYSIYKIKAFNCFFCTSNRPKAQTHLRLSQIYPSQFYYRFSLVKDFEEPYFPKNVYDGILPLLHQSLYSDYFNYLPNLKTNRDIENKSGLVFTKPHYLNNERIRNLKILNYLGLPISLMFVVVFLLNLRDTIFFLVKRNKKFFINFLFTIAAGAIFFQFLMYILTYPDYVNIHSGYLYPLVFILLLLISKYFTNRWAVLLTMVFIASYSIMSYFTFFIR